MSDSMTNILFFDTETTEDGKHLIDIGAVSEDGASIHTSDRNAFASFAAEHEYLCGHNMLSHDPSASFPFAGIRISSVLQLHHTIPAVPSQQKRTALEKADAGQT